MLPLLKDLGFISPDGKPTTRYHDYRDHSRSKGVMAEALRDAYGDIFLIKEHPTDSDKAAIQGKFKSFHNVSDHVASLMTKTFLLAVKLSDLKAALTKKLTKASDAEAEKKTKEPEVDLEEKRSQRIHAPGLHYNIQIVSPLRQRPARPVPGRSP